MPSLNSKLIVWFLFYKNYQLQSKCKKYVNGVSLEVYLGVILGWLPPLERFLHSWMYYLLLGKFLTSIASKGMAQVGWYERKLGKDLRYHKKLAVLSPKKPNHKNVKENSATSQIIWRTVTFMQLFKIDLELEIEL